MDSREAEEYNCGAGVALPRRVLHTDGVGRRCDMRHSRVVRWATLRVAAIFASTALVAVSVLTPGYRAPLDRLHGDDTAHAVDGLTSGVLKVHRDAGTNALPYLTVDVAVDEDFIQTVGSTWRVEAIRIVDESRVLLAEVGVDVRVASVQVWRSDEGASVTDLMHAFPEQVHSTDGNLLLAITGQYMGSYDGWAQRSSGALIAHYYSRRPHNTVALLAHEVGHLLGAEHHASEDECTGDGCVMDREGFVHADDWCDHHLEVIQETLDAALARRNDDAGVLGPAA